MNDECPFAFATLRPCVSFPNDLLTASHLSLLLIFAPQLPQNLTGNGFSKPHFEQMYSPGGLGLRRARRAATSRSMKASTVLTGCSASCEASISSAASAR